MLLVCSTGRRTLALYLRYFHLCVFLGLARSDTQLPSCGAIIITYSLLNTLL